MAQARRQRKNTGGFDWVAFLTSLVVYIALSEAFQAIGFFDIPGGIITAAVTIGVYITIARLRGADS